MLCGSTRHRRQNTEYQLERLLGSLLPPAPHTAGPVIGRSRLSPPTLQPKSHLYISRKGIARPRCQLPHLCVCERVYIFPGSVHIFSFSRIGSWEYINRSKTHECRNWDYASRFRFWEYLFNVENNLEHNSFCKNKTTRPTRHCTLHNSC